MCNCAMVLSVSGVSDTPHWRVLQRTERAHTINAFDTCESAADAEVDRAETEV